MSDPRGEDFFPLTVDYRERTYAAGKFPGGFKKREGAPSTKEILTARLADRPIRPLFPEGYINEVQIMTTVLSADRQNDPDVFSIIGSSAALHVSKIPFLGPIGAVRLGLLNGERQAFPTATQLETSALDLIVAGTEDAGMIKRLRGAEEMAACTAREDSDHYRDARECANGSMGPVLTPPARIIHSTRR